MRGKWSLWVALAAVAAAAAPPTGRSSALAQSAGGVTRPSTALSVTSNGAAIVIENSSGQPVSIASEIVLERLVGAQWSAVSLVPSLRARSVCDDRVGSRCVTLAPGELLRPVPWTGWSCGSQCSDVDCNRNGRPAGTFRYAIRSCDGAPLATSAPFVNASTAPVHSPPRRASSALPEPSPPRVECIFTAQTRCFHDTPTRRALQAPPFVFCAPTRPRLERSSNALDPPLQFSAARTQQVRVDVADACCYVEHTAQACR